MRRLLRSRTDKAVLDAAHAMAVEPWESLLRELRGDRGFLLGSEEYREMDPLDRMKALKSIDERIREINEWLRHYEEVRKRGR
tara:strand:- start:404 stop:652 length:249 start_codon:yes stop_codon:yes gene_type:complete